MMEQIFPCPKTKTVTEKAEPKPSKGGNFKIVCWIESHLTIDCTTQVWKYFIEDVPIKKVKSI
jgi:hypothetical protein